MLVSRIGRWLKANNRVPFFVALLIFVATLGAYLYYWSNLRSNVNKDMNVTYNRQVRLFGDSLQTRVQLYETLLRGGAGLFMLDNQITADNWTQYFQPYEIANHYPDVRGIVFAQYVAQNNLANFIAQRKAEDSSFSIYPPGERAAYAPVLFVARYTGSPAAGAGYDGLSESVRREAMNRAADTGGPVVSGRVNVSAGGKETALFLMYLPVYKQGVPISTIADRQAALIGFSYMSVDARMMFNELFEANNPNFAIRIVDPSYVKTHPDSKPTYQSQTFASISKQKHTLVRKAKLDLYGHTYEVTYAGATGLVSDAERQLPIQALLRGIFSSLLFAALVWYLITYRERKLNHWKQKEVQSAKDDLLSLASHQLRTPATVVKQYVGMLLQGYGGPLSGKQINMLTHAYDSNERQLEIINQLLYVARLDAGRISLHKESVDLPKLIKAVVADQRQAALDRGQKLKVHVPKKMYIVGDSRYLRMVLENLLSNAIKYTPNGGMVTFSARDEASSICIIVQDTGVGLAKNDVDTIFDKFTRVENSLSTDVNGSGVGLYLTKEIITLHGGVIEVSSVPGKGSTFTVRLPKNHQTEMTNLGPE